MATSLEQLMQANYGATAPTLTPGRDVVQANVAAFTDPNSPYIQNARQRGLELAATRGGINSSIAAGAAERSALEAAQPLISAATSIDQQGQQVAQENWLNTQNFNRSLYGQYATTRLNSAVDMLNLLQQAAVADPELYSPEVTSGLSNFFSRNMNDILSRYGFGT